MGNIQILNYGDKVILSGLVKSIGEKAKRGNTFYTPVKIAGKSYDEEKKEMVDDVRTIFFYDHHDISFSDLALKLKVGQRIHLEVFVKDDVYFCHKINFGKEYLHWALSDGGSQMNVFYGKLRVKMVDDRQYAVVKVDGIPNSSISFYDKGYQNIKSVFKDGAVSRNGFVVTGKESRFSDKCFYKGYWFIAD